MVLVLLLRSRPVAGSVDPKKTRASCPFCRLVQRFGTDQRLQRSFPTHAPPTDAAGMQVEILALLCHGEHGADGDSGPR